MVIFTNYQKIRLIWTLLALCLGTLGLPLNGLSQVTKYQDNTQEKELRQFRILNQQAFKRGEILTYRLHYGWMDAGEVKVTLTQENLPFGGRNTLHSVCTGVSKGMVDHFFKVNDRYESYIDESSVMPFLFVRRVNEGGYVINQDYIFNPYSKKVDVGGNKSAEVPAYCQDMVSAFYYARCLNFDNAHLNDVFTVPSFVDGEYFEIKIRFVGREVISTDLGKIACIRFHPILQKGRIFKHEEDLNVFISDDAYHVPVSAQAKILVGSVKMDLIGFEGVGLKFKEK